MEKSLQAIKSKILKKEVLLKVLHKTHPHLTHLSESQLLIYFDIDTMNELSKYLKYLKRSTQAHADLSSQDSKLCSCTDSRGQLKDLYHSKESAQKEIELLSGQHKPSLSIYPCPNHCGWHLSKR